MNRSRQEQFAGIANLVVGRAAYFDTVEVQQQWRFRKAILSLAREHSDQNFKILDRKNLRGWVTYALALHQPHRRLIERLHTYVPAHDASIVHVHIANDLLTRTMADAMRVRDVLRMHFLPLAHHGPTKFVGRTTYFNGSRDRSSNFRTAIYPCESRTHPGYYACHLEARIRGARMLRKFGAREPAELLAFDMRRFFANVLRFVDLDDDVLGRLIFERRLNARRQLGASLRFAHGDRRAARMGVLEAVRRRALRESSSASDADISAHHPAEGLNADVLRLLPGYLKRAVAGMPVPPYVRMDTDWLLPTNTTCWTWRKSVRISVT